MIALFEKDLKFKGKVTEQNLKSLINFQKTLNDKYAKTAKIIQNCPELSKKCEIGLISLIPYLEKTQDIFYESKIKKCSFGNSV